MGGRVVLVRENQIVRAVAHAPRQCRFDGSDVRLWGVSIQCES
ncbi:MAG: hypothetical protein RIT02_3832 [Planctomycetota bacterium]